MGDKCSALVVVLDRARYVEDVEPIINAIKMVRGVLDVQVKTSYEVHEQVAESRAIAKWRKILLETVDNG